MPQSDKDPCLALVFDEETEMVVQVYQILPGQTYSKAAIGAAMHGKTMRVVRMTPECLLQLFSVLLSGGSQRSDLMVYNAETVDEKQQTKKGSDDDGT